MTFPKIRTGQNVTSQNENKTSCPKIGAKASFPKMRTKHHSPKSGQKHHFPKLEQKHHFPRSENMSFPKGKMPWGENINWNESDSNT